METEAYLKGVEAAFDSIMAAVAPLFTSAEILEVTEFSAAGEYGVALETLAAIIVEEDKPVTEEARAAIEALAQTMGLGDVFFPYSDD